MCVSLCDGLENPFLKADEGGGGNWAQNVAKKPLEAVPRQRPGFHGLLILMFI